MKDNVTKCKFKQCNHRIRILMLELALFFGAPVRTTEGNSLHVPAHFGSPL